MSSTSLESPSRTWSTVFQWMFPAIILSITHRLHRGKTALANLSTQETPSYVQNNPRIKKSTNIYMLKDWSMLLYWKFISETVPIFSLCINVPSEQPTIQHILFNCHIDWRRKRTCKPMTPHSWVHTLKPCLPAAAQQAKMLQRLPCLTGHVSCTT